MRRKVKIEVVEINPTVNSVNGYLYSYSAIMRVGGTPIDVRIRSNIPLELFRVRGKRKLVFPRAIECGERFIFEVRGGRIHASYIEQALRDAYKTYKKTDEFRST